MVTPMREANIVRMVIVPISGRQRISKIKNMRERELMKKLERGMGQGEDRVLIFRL